MKMSKTTKIIVACSSAVFALIAAAIVLLCTFSIEDDQYSYAYSYSIDGSGTVTVSEDKNGNTIWYAVPNQWQTFAGWYYTDDVGELNEFSTSSSITITSDTPNNLTAVFKASTLDALDRVLNGVYNKYSSAVASEEDYLNFSTDIDLNYTFGDTTGQFNIKVGGYINFSGEGTQFYVVVNSEESENTIFALYYVDAVDEAYLYVDVEGEQSKYPFISISGFLGNLPTPSSTTWSIENILTSAGLEDIYSMLESWFGLENAANFCGDAVNSENSTTFSLNLHSVLTTLKTMLSVLTNSVGETAGAIIEEVMDVLTGNYTGANILPELVLEFTVGYNTVDGVECVDSIGLNLSISDEYVLNIGDGITIPTTDITIALDDVVIPVTDLTITLNDIVFEFSETANTINEDVLAVFPEISKYFLNFHVNGSLTFLSGDSTESLTATDVYDVDLYTDLNIFALLDAITDDGFDYTQIDWDNLGFLSFTITVNEELTETTHTNADYINIFMDTDKYGPVLYVYVGGYDPELLLVTYGYKGLFISSYKYYYLIEDYILNTAFYLPDLVSYLVNNTESSEEESVSADSVSALSTTEETSSAQSIINLVVSILEQAISGEIDFNEMVVDVLTEVFAMLGNSSIDTYLGDLSYNEEYGIVIGTSAIRETIEGLIDMDSFTYNILLYIEINELGPALANVIMGENTTYLALNFNSISYGTVVRGASSEDGTLGDYYNEDGQSIIDLYNSKHTTLVGIEDESISISGTYSKETYLTDLLDTEYNVTGIFSDGNTSTTITNLVGDSKDITLAVIGVEVIEEHDTYATVKLILRKNIADNLESILSLMSEDWASYITGYTLPDEMKNASGVDEVLYNLGVPAGVYVYETTIYFS